MGAIPEGYEVVQMQSPIPDGYEPLPVPDGYEVVDMAPKEEPGVMDKLGQSFSAAVPAVTARFKGIEQAVAELPAPALGLLTPADTEALNARSSPEDVARIVGERKALEAEAKSKRPDVSKEGLVMQEVLNAPENIATSLASLGVGLAAGPAAGLMSFAAPAVGGGYTEARDKGKSPERALVYGGTEGAIEVGTEANPLFSALKVLKGSGLAQVAKEFFVKDFFGEQAATLLSDFNEWLSLNPNKTGAEFLAERPEAAARTAVATIASGGVQTGALYGVGKGAEAVGKKLEKMAELERAKAQVAADLSVGITPDNRAENADLGLPNIGGDAMVSPVENNAVAGASGANLPPSDTIPDAPLTPDEIALAELQERSIRTGVSHVPENTDPAVQAVNASLEVALTNPVFVEEGTEEAVQERMVELRDEDPMLSPEVAERRARDEFPSSIPPPDRLISWSSEDGVAGLTPRQAPAQSAGSVRLLGWNDEQFSPELRGALGETMLGWVQRFLDPNAKVIVNLSGFANDAVGAYQQLPDGTHVISPRELVRAARAEGEGGLNQYNQFTQVQFYGALTHEFGHAVVMSQFFKGIPAGYEDLRQNLNRTEAGMYTPEQLAALPEAQRQVISEFYARKAAVLSGQMTAKELMDTWSGTWKVGKDLMKTKNLQSLYVMGRKALQNAGYTLSGNPNDLKTSEGVSVSANELLEALGDKEYYLSFEEYMAEQFTRYAHAKKLDEGTVLGRYFKMALDTLRNFFRQMKAEGVIQPGVAFTEWLDKVVQTRAEQAAEAPKPKARKRKAKAVKGQEELIQEAVANNVQHPTALEDLANDPEAQGRLRERVKATFPPMAARTPAEKKLAKAAMEAIAQGNELEFEEILREYEGVKPRFDVKGKGGAWSKGAAPKLMQDFANQLLQQFILKVDDKSMWEWSLSIGQNYLNKYAGTKDDPIKSVILSQAGEGVTVENVWDEVLQEQRTGQYPEWGFNQEHLATLGIFRSYLQHAADYLIGNVPKDRWSKYDLVRLVKETEAWDERMEAAKAVPVRERLAPLPVYHAYPDGFRWVIMPKADTSENVQLIMDVGLLGKWCTQEEPNARSYGAKDKTLYVLTKPDGDVHAQVLVEDGDIIQQFKGKANQALKPEYLPYAHDFIKDREEPWHINKDLDKVGMVDLRNVALYSGLLDRLRDAMPDMSDYQPEAAVEAALNPILLEEKEAAIAWYVGGKGFTVFKGEQLNKVVQQMREVTAENIAQFPPGRRLILNAINARHHHEDLRFDKDDPSEDIHNARVADTALRKLGAKGNAARWASKAINFVSNAQHYVLQLQQLAYTETNTGLRAMVRYISEMNALKNNMMSKAVDISQRWEKLSARGATQFEKAIQDEYFSEGHVAPLGLEAGVWVHRGGVGLDTFLTERGVDLASEEGQEIRQLFLDYKNSILNHINTIESAAITMIRERYQKAPLVVRKKIAEIREASNAWRKAPYMPRGHFGDYVVKVYAKNPETGKRELVHQEHFESETDQDLAVTKLQERFPAKDIKPSHIDSTARLFCSMPSDFLMTLSDTGNFSDDQIAAIGEAMIPIRTPKMFKVFARDASKVAGAETDVIRNYANWVEDNANATAKFIYTRRITQAIAWTRSDLRDANAAGDVKGYRKLQRIYETMQRAKDFTMHPKAEWFKARNYVALAYLLWAPKTALMNLSGLILTWASLSAEHGDLRGNQEFVKTMRDLTVGKLTKDDMWALDRAENDGLLDQGFGYFMAGLANSGNLARRIRKNSLGKLQRFFVEGGMAPFTAVEKVNRKMTLLPFFRLGMELALKRGMIPEQARIYAYELASSKTKKLQNDYASGNRPPVFQGRRSLFMVFYSFPQYMLWIMSGGYERGVRLEAKARGETPRSWLGGTTVRMWLIFLFLAGYEGVPFGEFTQKMLQWLWNKFGGGENLELEARRFMKDVMGIESSYWRNVVQKGLLHNVGGVDLSGSYSMGTPLPLTKMEGLPDNANELMGAIFKELAGPFGGVVSGGAGLLGADEIGVKELAKSLPGEAGSLARAAYAADTGLVNTKGARVLRGEDERARDVTTGEIVLKGLGFTLTEESEAREFRRVKKQMADYWSERRQGLQRDYNEARKSLDRQAILDVQAAVREYNTEIPNRDLWLSTKELNEGFNTRRKAVLRDERDMTTRRERGLAQDIRSVD